MRHGLPFRAARSLVRFGACQIAATTASAARSNEPQHQPLTASAPTGSRAHRHRRSTHKSTPAAAFPNYPLSRVAADARNSTFGQHMMSKSVSEADGRLSSRSWLVGYPQPTCWWTERGGLETGRERHNGRLASMLNREQEDFRRASGP